MKTNEKENGPSSPTIPSITFDSVFDDSRDPSQDTVYSTETSGSILASWAVDLHTAQLKHLMSLSFQFSLESFIYNSDDLPHLSPSVLCSQ